MAVPAMWKIPQEIRVRLSDQSGRQRCMIADDQIVMVLHRVPQPRKPAREGVYFWRKPGGDWEYSRRRLCMGDAGLMSTRTAGPDARDILCGIHVDDQHTDELGSLLFDERRLPAVHQTKCVGRRVDEG